MRQAVSAVSALSGTLSGCTCEIRWASLHSIFEPLEAGGNGSNLLAPNPTIILHLLKRKRKSAPILEQADPSENKRKEFGSSKVAFISNKRRWLFRCWIVIVIPLLIIGAAESLLRLTHYGHPTTFLIRKQVRGQAMLIDNPWFGLRFFPPALSRSPNPVSIPAEKPAGVYRIFLFGESAAMGDPRPAYGMGRYLEALLRTRYPGMQFEVVCVAMTAINSHAVLPIARECAHYQGDLWVVYMGNNEFAGPFGANTVFGPQAPPAFAVQAILALQKSRLGQWLVEKTRELHFSTDTPKSWGGLKMFLDHQLPPQDQRRERVYANFQRNLAALLAAAERAHVPVVLSSVACNLKDCAPFGSYEPEALKSSKLDEWKKACADGATNATQGNFPAAVSSLKKAAELNPTSANVQFQLGLCFLAVTNHAAAGESFVRARDLDTLPFRTDTRLNEIIAAEAAKSAARRVSYVDASQALAAATPNGIAGTESFHEHVHLNCEGNYRLAVAFAEQVRKYLPAQPTTNDAGWADFSFCSQQLGLSDWNRYPILEEVAKRLSEAPFTGQLQHAQRMEELTNAMHTVRLRMDGQALQAARAMFVNAVHKRPDDHYLHHNYAELLTKIGDLPGATDQMRAVCDLLPESYAGFLQLGRVLARQKKYEEARTELQTALRLRPDVFDVRVELGQVLAAQNKQGEALVQYQQAQRLHGEDHARVLLLQANILARQHKRTAAEDLLRQAITLRPDYGDAYELLGIELALDGHLPEAQAQFEQLVRLRPTYSEGHLNLGIALARQQRFREALEQFEATTRLDPQNVQAREFISNIQALQTQPDAR